MPVAVISPGGQHGVAPSFDEFSKLLVDVAALKARIEALEETVFREDPAPPEPLPAAAPAGTGGED